MVNEVTLNYMKDIAQDAVAFTENVYLPDIKAIASFYPEWFRQGGGIASKNLLCYGDFPEVPNDRSEKSLLMPSGAVVDGEFTAIHPVNATDPDEIQEFVDHSWYRYADGQKGRHHRTRLRTAAGVRWETHEICVARKRREVFLDQESSLEGPYDGNGPLGAPRSGLPQENAPISGTGRRVFEGTAPSL